MAAMWVLLPVMVSGAWGCGRGTGTAALKPIQSVKTATLEVVLLSDHDAIRHGKDAFVIEFKSVSNGSLVDVGGVRARATMLMPGMPMFAGIDVQRTDVPGRYAASSEFSMAGTWRLTVGWDGAIGTGSVAFSGTVQ